MRSQLAVRRPHTRQQMTNQRKGRGRAAKNAWRRQKQWQLSTTLVEPSAVRRAQVYAALSLAIVTNYTQQELSEAERASRLEKKKAQKAAKIDDSAARAEKERKAAEREARREAAEAEKRRHEEEEYRKWKEEQEKLEKEQAERDAAEKAEKEAKKKETDQNKGKKEEKKKAPAKEEKSKSKSKETTPAPAPVVEEIVVKKETKKVEAAPPVQAPEPVKEAKESKKSKKNKSSNSQSEEVKAPTQPEIVAPAAPVEPEVVAAPTPVEPEVVIPVETAPVQNEDKKSKKNKRNKKDSRTSESEAAALAPVPEPVVEKVEEPVVAAEQPSEQRVTSENLDFLDFVTPKSQTEGSESPEVPTPKLPTATPTNTPAEADLDFLDFVTSKDNRTAAKTDVDEPSVAETEKAAAEPAESLDFLDFVTAKEEQNAKKTDDEPIPEETPVEKETVAPSSTDADADLDFLDFVTAKDDRTAKKTDAESEQTSEPVAEPAIETIAEPVATQDKGGKKKNKKEKKTSESKAHEEPVAVEEAAAVVKTVNGQTTEAEQHKTESQVVEEVVVVVEEEQKSGGKKKNKKGKGKKQSESEPVEEPVVVQKEVTPPTQSTPETTPQPEQPAQAPANQKSGKKNKKKGSGNSESKEIVVPVAKQEPESQTVDIPLNGTQTVIHHETIEDVPILNGAHHVEAKKGEVVELDYGDPASVKKAADSSTNERQESGKKSKKNKKNKNSNSVSEQTTVAPVITELTKEDQLADDEVGAITGAAGSHSPPIQVHEVSSTEQETTEEGGVKTTVTTTTIQTATAVDDKDSSPTRFSQNVQKLVQATLAKHDIVEIDPTVKMTIDAKLIKLSEKKPAVVIEHKNFIKPLPVEIHFSRPTTPVNRDRVYKLLPKDILFCAGLMDTHGENYSAMAADPRNVYKDNSRSLQRKIRIFKESPHYQIYQQTKKDGRNLEEVLAAEAH